MSSYYMLRMIKKKNCPLLQEVRKRNSKNKTSSKNYQLKAGGNKCCFKNKVQTNVPLKHKGRISTFLIWYKFMHSYLLVPLLAYNMVKYCQSNKQFNIILNQINYFNNKAQNTKPYQCYTKIKKKKKSLMLVSQKYRRKTITF